MEEPSVIDVQKEHAPHGAEVGPFLQFKALANIRAVDVLPTPLGPENK
jgi:hypothetical protein